MFSQSVQSWHPWSNFVLGNATRHEKQTRQWHRADTITEVLAEKIRHVRPKGRTCHSNLRPGHPALEYGSLPDGLYQLSVISNKVIGYAGDLDGDGNGTGGDNYTGTFHRLFGDSDGNGTVNSSDFAVFRTVFGVAGPTFDFDGDGVVSSNDFAEFRKRFGLTLP